MSDAIFSLKMRASQGSRHISGAEKILPQDHLGVFMNALCQRALEHANGEPDMINLKMERLSPGEICHFDALPVSARQVDSPENGLREMTGILASLGVPRAAEIVDLLKHLHNMRGAVLLDADTLERLEPDHERGVRATRMDSTPSVLTSVKDHFVEALVLATKVVHAPGIIAELCISDDPDYTTGYIASQKIGYVRISPLKVAGNHAGGRIFLFRGDHAGIPKTLNVLENCPVLVHKALPLKPMPRQQRIRQTLKELHGKSLFRQESISGDLPGARVRMPDGEYLMFASNNYLDLAADPRVLSAAKQAIDQYGAGTGGSRLTTGTRSVHRELEKSLAEFKETEDAILFNTGFAANSGIIPALCHKTDVIFSDELNHASIIDGCRLSGAEIVVYRHRDMADLARKIAERPAATGLIVSDAVFSMDGDVAPLPEILQIADRHDLFTLIDEAHSTGVLGKNGHGIMEHFGLPGDRGPDVLVGTLSKALGSQGGFAACSRNMADYLRNKARSYVFSTAIPAMDAAAALAALRILQQEPERGAQLRQNVRFLLAELERLGMPSFSESAIVPILIGTSKKTMQIAETLWHKHVIVSPIRYPSVAENGARLRITVMPTHTPQELTFLAKMIRAAFSGIHA